MNDTRGKRQENPSSPLLLILVRLLFIFSLGTVPHRIVAFRHADPIPIIDHGSHRLWTTTTTTFPLIKSDSPRITRHYPILQMDTLVVSERSGGNSGDDDDDPQRSIVRDTPVSISDHTLLPVTQPLPATTTTTTATVTSNNRNHHHPKLAAALEFANLVGQLKTTPRTGWQRRHIVPCESVADHSWRVAVLAYLLVPSSSSSSTETMDWNKVLQMALVHDLAECIVGDITPDDGVSKPEKHAREEMAMRQLTQLLHIATSTTTTSTNSSITNDNDETTESATTTTPPSPPPSSSLDDNVILKLFHEYEQRDSIESIMVKDLDLLDLLLQANTYEQQYASTNLNDFFDGTPPSRFQTPTLRQLAEYIHQQRNDRIMLLLRHTNDNETEQQQQQQQQRVVDPTDEMALPMDNNNNNNSDPEVLLSASDVAFVTAYTPTLTPHEADRVRATVMALRQWDNRRSSSIQKNHPALSVDEAAS